MDTSTRNGLGHPVGQPLPFPISAVWCLGHSSLCPHSDAHFTQAPSRQCTTGLVCSSSPSETWSFRERSCDDWSCSFNHPFLFSCAGPHLSHTVSALPTGEVHTQLSARGGSRQKPASSFHILFPEKKQTCFLGETPRKHKGS